MKDFLEQSLNRRNKTNVNIFIDLGKNRDVSNIDISNWATLTDIDARDLKFFPNRSN